MKYASRTLTTRKSTELGSITISILFQETKLGNLQYTEIIYVML